MGEKTSPNTKWIVIGALGIAFFLIFKSDISALLGRTETVSVTGEGIELKTVSTPIGETTVSDKVSMKTAGISPGARPSFSGSGWAINWPAGRWTSVPSAAGTVGAELYIGFNRSWGNFNPNINVMRQSTQGRAARAYAEFSAAQAKQFGGRILTLEVDDDTQSGVVAYELPALGSTHIARFFLRGGTAFIATATQRQGIADALLWREMNTILNSFRPS